MKKYTAMLTTVLVSTTLLTATGCHKALDYLYSNPQQAAQFCQIKSIAFGNDIEITDTMVFAYNSLGNPISGTLTGGPATGNPNAIFRYDKHNRLTDYIGAYDNGGGEYWHKYYYANEKSENIIADTNYIFPRSIAGASPTDYDSRYAFSYTYDSQNRVSTVLYPNGVVATYNYAIDTISGEFDKKVNLNLTNKVFEFINLSYYQHNPFFALTYNELGLPEKIKLSSEGNFFYFLDIQSRTDQISYSCR